MTIPHQAAFHHRSLFELHGTFDSAYRICGDYEFLLRDILTRDPLFIPGLTVTKMGAGGTSDRPESALTMTREFHRARRQHGLERHADWLSFPILKLRMRGWLVRRIGEGPTEVIASKYRRLTRRAGRR
jgi:hypothetical protein